MEDMPIYDGEHCPMCGGVPFQCGHAMTGEDMLEEFADGLPAEIINRLGQIETGEALALIVSGPPRLRQIVGAATLDEMPDLPYDYWAQDPGVLKAFFEGDRPGGSGTSYWHREPEAFETGVRDEAKQLLAWLDEHMPAEEQG